MFQTKLLCLFTILFSAFTIHAQTDVKNSKDYPALGRLPNFYIQKYTVKEFDSHPFYYDNTNHVYEGRKYVIEYWHTNWKDADYNFLTRRQILKNYSDAIRKAGGRVLFERYNAEHGYYSFETKEKKKVWVQVKISSGKFYTLIIIEEEKMRQDLEINADLIKNALDIEGKIAIYGIYFDTGKSIIKKESEPALNQIAEFLKSNPTINCWVVGHTDSDGSFEINSQLSLARAKAIKEILSTKYGIANHRLFAEGVGPLAPVATNTTEEGKALNRRVELVKK